MTSILTARLTSRRPLLYAEGADSALDRPAHVRGGSSLAWIAGRIALIQDDANFIALVDPWSGVARGITLPAGDAGLRQFDDARANKKHRLDLEACAAVDTPGGPVLLAFGSGSSKRRRSVVLIEGIAGDAPGVILAHVPPFYRRLDAEQDFCGSALNVEGAFQDGTSLRLFSRGNGAPADGVRPVNAACSVDLQSLLGYLRNPASLEPPDPARVARYDLGAMGGVPLGFTDAMSWRGSVLYSAAAEASPDAVQDGPVSGSAIGVIDVDGGTRWSPITDEAGAILRVKVEGLVSDPTSDSRLFVVLDADDAGAASELCGVELDGPWSPR